MAEKKSKKTAAKKPALKQTKKAAAEQPKKTTKATPAAKQCAKKPAAKKQVKSVASTQKKTDIGYTAKIKLPDGRVLVASETGLRDIKTLPSRIVLNSKEQAVAVAANLASAYGKGAKPIVGTSKKTARQVTHTFKSE